MLFPNSKNTFVQQRKDCPFVSAFVTMENKTYRRQKLADFDFSPKTLRALQNYDNFFQSKYPSPTKVHFHNNLLWGSCEVFRLLIFFKQMSNSDRISNMLTSLRLAHLNTLPRPHSFKDHVYHLAVNHIGQ